jgi:hypothetical protein
LLIGFIAHFDTARDYTLQFTIRHTHISVHSNVFTSLCLVTASNGRRSPSSGFLSYPCASASSFSQQQLTRTEPLQSSKLLTNLLNSIQLTLAEEERKREEKESGEAVRDTIFKGEQEIKFPVLKVHKQYPLGLIV